MPVYEITAPDGRTFEVTGPDGTTKEQALARVKAQYSQRTASPMPDPMLDPTGSFAKNALAGSGKAFVDIGRGVTDIAGDAIGAVTGTRPGFAQRNDAAIAESRRLDAPLMDTAGGLFGNIATNVATALPTMAIPGANTVAGAGLLGATMGAVQPTDSGESRMANIALGGAAGSGGQKVANAASGYVANKMAASAARKGQNAARDTVIDEGLRAGYRFDPLDTNPEGIGLLTSTARRLSGMTSSEKLLSNHNQTVSNKLARQSIGLPEDAPLSVEAIDGVRSRALDAYKALDADLSDMGAVKIKDIPKLSKIMAEYDELSEIAPGALGGNKDMEAIRALMERKEYPAGSMIRLIRRLRQKADRDFRAIGDDAKIESARATRALADGLEDSIDAALQDAGNVGGLEAFRAARTLLAKTHTIEDALEGGNINAAKVLRQAKKKPLTDELKEIADVADHFPRVTKITKGAGDTYGTVEKIGQTVGGAGLLFDGGAISGPVLAASLARPAARKAVLSGLLNRRLATPQYDQTGGLVGLLGTEYGQHVARTLPTALIGASK